MLSTTLVGRHPRRGREPPAPGARPDGDGAAGRIRIRPGSRTASSTCSAPCRRSTCPGASSPSTRAIARSKASKRGSKTETYVGLRLEIENWRWAGVPFYIRAGKALATRATGNPGDPEGGRPASRAPRGTAPAGSEPVRVPDRSEPWAADRDVVQGSAGWEPSSRTSIWDLSFVEELGRPPEPYERLLHDALVGDFALFTREDVVEESWRILEPLLENPPPLQSYVPGSWGPSGADDLVRGHPPWHLPWLSG